MATPSESGTGPPAGKLRVVLVDPSRCVRERLRKGLEACSGVEIVGEAETDRQALDLFFHLHPEVVVVSTCLPAKGGFEVLRCIKRAVPHCEVILTSPCPNQFIGEVARLLGAAGVCTSNDECSELSRFLKSLWLSRVGKAFKPSQADGQAHGNEPSGDQ